MIEIIVNNESLDLFPDTSIEITLNNPMFNEEGTIEGSYTLPFKIPLTDKNKVVLQFANIIESNSRFTDIGDAVIKTEGVPYKTGVLVLQSILDNGTANVFLKIEVANTLKLLDGLTIKDVTDKQIDIVPDTSFPRKKSIQFTTENMPNSSSNSGIALKVNGVLCEVVWHDGDDTFSNEFEFQREMARLLIVVIRAAHPDLSVAVFATENRFNVSLSDVGDYLSPLSIEIPAKVEDKRDNIYLPNSIYEYGNYIHANPNISSSDYTMYINNFYEQYRTVNPPDDMIRFPRVLDNSFEIAPIYRNGVSGGNVYWVNIASYTTNLNQQIFTPCVYLKYVIAKIENIIGYTFEGLFKTDDFESLLIFPTAAPYIIDRFPNNQDFVLNLPKYNVKDYMPEIGLLDLIKQLLVSYGCYWDVDSQKKIINVLFKEDVLANNTFVDYTNKSGKYTDLDKPNVKGYVLKNTSGLQATLDNEDQENDPYLPFITGDGSTILEINHSSFPYLEVGAPPPPNGNEETYIDKLETNNSNLKLLFYKGIVTVSGLDIPTASMKSNSFNLSLFGDNGLFKLFHQKNINFLTNKTTSKRSEQLAISDLLNFDFKDKHRIDRVDYLVKSLRTVLTMQGVKPSTLELYSIDLSPNDNTTPNN